MRPTRDFSDLTPDSFLMIAEGNSEEGFLVRYGKIKQIANSFVSNVQGEDKLATVLKALGPYQHNLRSLGLMFDANESASNRRQGIVHILQNHGYQYSSADADVNGVDNNGLRVGIFLSPGQDSGSIEGMVLAELKTKSFWPCIETFAECARQQGVGAGFNDKTLAQLGISTLEGKTCGIGVAFKRNLLDVNHPAYEGIRRMVDALA